MINLILFIPFGNHLMRVNYNGGANIILLTIRNSFGLRCSGESIIVYNLWYEKKKCEKLWTFYVLSGFELWTTKRRRMLSIWSAVRNHYSYNFMQSIVHFFYDYYSLFIAFRWWLTVYNNLLVPINCRNS